MKTRFAPINQKKRLKKVLKPYRFFEEWCHSSSCLRSRQEVLIISMYNKTGSYAYCSNELGLSMIAVANNLEKAILRLEVQLDKYMEWEQGQANVQDVFANLGIESFQDLKMLSWEELKAQYEKKKK